MSDIIILNSNELQHNLDPSLEQLVEEFLGQHDVRKNSRDRYRKSLKQFLNWAQGKRAGQITKSDIIDYKEHLISIGKSPMTVGAYLVAVRLFYVYLEEKYKIDNVAKNVASPKKENKFEKNALTEDECSRLLDHMKTVSKRDYAMINLMLRTGMRTIEVSRANIEDVSEIAGKKCIYVHGKGRDSKKDYVLLTDKAIDPIKEYLDERGNWNPSDPLFISTSPNNFGGRLTTKTISTIARDGLDAIGLVGKKYTAHSLRHTAGSLLISKGVSLDRVKEVLRHQNVSTTLGYVHMANEKQRIQEAPEHKLDELF